MKMEEWKECKLGEIAHFTTGKLNSNAAEDNGLYPFFTCSPETYRINSYAFDTNAILLAGNNAEGNFNIKRYSGKFNAYQRTYVITVDDNTDLNFLFYALKLCLADFKHISQGTATKFLTAQILNNFVIRLPPLPTQQKIAAILSSLDDKIELNNKINTNLEQQAQALFKNWFVDFEPFGGKMPEGWKVGKLSDILCLKKNPIQPGEDTSLPYLPIDLIPIKSLAIREVRPNEEALSSLLRFDENDILIGAMRVYFHRVAIAPFDGITRTTCFVLEPFNPNYFAYAAITCNQDLAIDYAQKTSKGSTMPYAVWEGGLGDFEIPIPDEATAEKFNNIVKPLLEQIKQSYFENKTLQELRESLLPKLMNGEIETNFNIISKE